MRRWIGFFLFFLLMTLPLSVGAKEADTYLVRTKPVVRLSSEKGSHPSYQVLTREELDRQLTLGQVLSYEPNDTVSLFGDSWNLEMIGADFSHFLGCYGSETIIGVIDSGFTAPDGNTPFLLEGHNYLDGSCDTTDTVGHGTFVVGILASETYGIATRASIVPLKCFDEKTTSLDFILQAIYDAVDVYHCDIINMSVGMDRESDLLREAVDYAIEKGAIVVAAAGNGGGTTPAYPAAWEEVIGVGSVSPQGTLSSFSRQYHGVTAVAPGESLESLSLPGFTSKSGTSFATPHVSALAAVVQNIQPTTQPEFLSLLRETSVDGGEAGYDTAYGYGIVDGESMIRKLLENRELFLSPILREEGKASVRLYNPTRKDRSLLGIWVSHKNTFLQGFSLHPMTLAAETVIPLESDLLGDNLRCMIWDDAAALTPLVPLRKWEAPSALVKEKSL